MGPNETYEELRKAIARYEAAKRRGDKQAMQASAERIIQHYTELDNWLAVGGFMPSVWRMAR